MASVASVREGFQEDHAADEQVERVDVAAQREHSEPTEEGDRPARVQDQFAGRGQRGDVLFRPVDQDRIDEGRRDRGSHREPSDGEGERREVPHEVREEAGRHGQERPEQEERRPDPDPIGHPTEDDGGDSRGEREEGEEQAEGEGGARKEEGAEGRCGGRQAVDPALARECEGRPPTDAPQVQGEGEGFVGLDETSDEEEIHANDDRREAEGEGLRRAYEVDEPEARRHLVAERLDGEDPEQPSVAATPRSSERQRRRRTDRHGVARRKTTYKETPNRLGGESVYNRFSMSAACGDRLAW